ncbi:MAG: archease [Candidatus Omnitrophica bacterium]|nr:archease [Candidatus Omnitrophota bacterium]
MAIEEKGYAFFDHTADIGIRAQGATLAELFVKLAHGLTELLAEDTDLKPRQAKAIQLTAPAAASLLLAWLQELLFWFAAGHGARRYV